MVDSWLSHISSSVFLLVSMRKAAVILDECHSGRAKRSYFITYMTLLTSLCWNVPACLFLVQWPNSVVKLVFLFNRLSFLLIASLSAKGLVQSSLWYSSRKCQWCLLLALIVGQNISSKDNIVDILCFSAVVVYVWKKTRKTKKWCWCSKAFFSL